MSRVLLRASLLKSVGPGQRYLLEREWRDDGRVVQRTNAGEPIKEDDWREVARWTDLVGERRRAMTEGWAVAED